MSNKRIAKNTLVLYLRTFVSLIISFYTSRIVLSALGVVDFGIFTVVGGIVIMFSFLNNAMSVGTQRFLSIEIAKNDLNRLNSIFNNSISLHLLIAVLVVLLSETIGLWFLNNYINIPVDKLKTANWVFQFAVFSFFVSILTVPYYSIIVSYEKLSVVASLTILETFLKLIIAISLLYIEDDRLFFYSFLVFLVTFLIRLCYYIYSRKNIISVRYRFDFDRKLFKPMFFYNNWNLVGNVSSVTYNQGTNILLNIFFGPIVNASRGVSYQLSNSIFGFVSNFQIAVNPQIIKSFAIGDYSYLHKLVISGAKFSYFLLFLLVLPLSLEIDFFLKLWLGEVPEYTPTFCRLILLMTLIDSISGTLGSAAQASGKIKLYQFLVGMIQILILPISYIFFKMKFEPYSVFIISNIMFIISLCVRLIIICPLIQLSRVRYFKMVLLRLMFVSLLSLLVPYWIITNIDFSLMRVVYVIFFSLLSSCILIYFLGLNNQERNFIKNLFNKIKIIK